MEVMTTFFIFINALSILILYLLMFSLFYQLDSVKSRQSTIEAKKEVSERQLKNLISSINYNDQYLKKYIDHVHSDHRPFPESR